MEAGRSRSGVAACIFIPLGDDLRDAWVITYIDITTSNDTTNHAICGQVNSFSLFAIFDADMNPPTINAPSLFPLGQTIVTFTATDNAGNQGSCQARVNVISPKTNSNGSSSYFKEAGYNAYATFDVKYATGATTPSGSLTFSSTKTRRKVVSTGITSLTATGKSAVIQGPCTLNGINGYSFTATVGDNATPGAGSDTFAITVTGTNGFNYMASGTIISGEYNVSQ